MRLAGRRALVVGLRRSGKAAARLLCRKGARVTVTDLGEVSQFKSEMEALQGLPVSYKLGRHDEADFSSAQLVVLSPGVPTDLPQIEIARRQGAEVIGELELGYRFLRAPLFAASGTNGKSTTVELAGEMLSRSGLRVFVGGNIGTPLCEAALSERGFDAIVCEVSSFQLETVKKFRPAVAVLLNIAPDHLDRYASFDEYVAAKKRLFAFQRRGDAAVLNADDSLAASLADKKSVRKLSFSSLAEQKSGAWADGSGFVLRLGRRKPLFFDVPSPALRGSHNRENAMAAAIGAALLGARSDCIRAALREFKGLPHRLQLVGNVAGVDYVNDSKATNEAAALMAVKALPSRIVLIAGGKDKGLQFQALAEACRRKVVFAVLVGETATKLRDALSGVCPTRIVGSIEQAVEEAALRAEPGMSVLLAPAASSFDMFSSFEERGARFMEAVRRLQKEQNAYGLQTARWPVTE